MHLSKHALYIAIIAYAGAILIFQDYGPMLAATGTLSAVWLGKMLIDILFAGMGAVRLLGPAFFSGDDEDDEVAIHEEDLHFSDTALFGLFMVNVAANLGWHAYETVMTTDATSFYYSLWTIAEVIVLFFSFILFSHARKAQRKLARKAREAAQAAGPKPVRGRDAA